MSYSIFRRHRRPVRALDACVQYVVDALEARTLLNAYLVTNTNNSGTGSLRQALLDANANPGTDSVTFNIAGAGVHRIAPTSLLPVITDPVSIDGDSQPGYAGQPLIELDGTAAGDCNGLEFKTGGNQVVALDVHSFAFDGVVFAEDTATNPVGGNTIVNSYLGTDPTGTVAMGNEINGIHLVHSPHDVISGNLISGNRQSGVFVADALSTDTHIEGNLIGTDVTGLSPLGNGLNGVALGAPAARVESDGFASGNVVGGTDPTQRNLISANGQSGVWIEGGSNNVVQGNSIGVAADGVTPLGNGTKGLAADPRFGIEGVFILGGSDNQIGGTADGAGNVISANQGDGVRIDAIDLDASFNVVQGNLIGTDNLGNAGPGLGNQNGISVRNDAADPTAVFVSHNAIGGNDEADGNVDGTVKARNVVSGNRQHGIAVVGPVDFTDIEGNYVGTDAQGLRAVGNAADGISVGAFVGQAGGPTDTTIGGDQPGAANFISGNGADGININPAQNVAVLANAIGTDKTGKVALGNGGAGVAVLESSNVFIGAVATPQGSTDEVSYGNLIAGSHLDAVFVGSASTGVHVVGNLIGTDVTGNVALGNSGNGVVLSDSASNIVGGTTEKSRNIIARSGGHGVLITGQGASSNVVEGNYIGLSLDGKSPLGSNGNGVEIDNAANNTIGGHEAGTANYIADNVYGVRLEGQSATGNEIAGNRIGTDAAAQLNPLFGNTGAGVYVHDAAVNTVDSNIVRGNANGAIITGANATANKLYGNLITDNTGSGVAVLEQAGGNEIGGAAAAQGNVISRNREGVSLETGASGNDVAENFIGTDDNGNFKAGDGNTDWGIAIVDSGDNTVNGNTIRGNGVGIYVEGDSLLNTVSHNVITNSDQQGVLLSGASDNEVNGANVIAANGEGVRLEDLALSNTVEGNFIGSDESGALQDGFGNFGSGIFILDSLKNTVRNNTIRGNGTTGGDGITFSGDSSHDNIVEGNVITDNLRDGVHLTGGANENFIGFDTRNLISGNDSGVVIDGNAHDNFIDGNDVGTDDAGAFIAGAGNTTQGIAVIDGINNIIRNNKVRGNKVGVYIAGDKNTVGENQVTNSAEEGIDVASGVQNLIRGNVASNNLDGIALYTEAQQADVTGNFVGTDASGAYSTTTGNTEAGIAIRFASQNTIEKNIVRGNPTGILITGATATANKVVGNVVTNNTGNGLDIADGASNNAVGGLLDGDGNQISQNTKAGVFVEAGTGNAILHNQIFNNGGLGIDLAPEGPTPNDPPREKDADTGPNNLQNSPDLTLATIGGSNRIVGTLASAANATFILEFFNLDNPDPSGYGQGDRYLTIATATTNASGIATFDVALPGGVLPRTFISATATDAGGNTSEFSKVVRVATDTDGDGIPDDIENSDPANGGDGNSDGIPDSQQANVVSFPNAITGDFVTLQAPTGTAFSNVTPLTNPSPDDAPDASFDLGFFGFTLNGATPGGAVDVDLFLPTGSSPLAYDRYGPVPGNSTPQWYNWNYGGRTGATIDGNHVTLHFIDGQLGDDDLAANGAIVDPGGPAFPVRFTVTNTNDSGPGSLRQAILDANGHIGQNIIDFHIGTGGVQTIIPLSPLPNITDAVTIDGTTQPGFAGKPIVELSGQSTFGSGLTIAGPSVTIRGLVVNRWSDYGITTLRFGRTPFNFDIEGNYLGTDVTGTIALGNRWGIGTDGGDGIIGGDTPASRNVISGNTLDGIAVSGTFSLSVRGNLIGLAADGASPLGNAEDGILISNTASNTTVGGPDPADGNVIAFNKVAGIENFLPGQGHAFLSNVIYGNKVLGINLGASTGADLNDSGAQDNTFSNPQNYPVLYSAASANGQTTISGYLDTHPNQTYRLQFFSNPTTTASGYGQGQTYLGTATVQTDASGHADFTVTLAVAVADRQLITATATDPSNNTSEFSMRIAVGDVLGNVYVVNTTDDTDDGVADATHTSLREAIIAANNHPGRDTIMFNIPGGGVHTIAPTRPLPAIVDSVVLDATSQPGYAGTPLIQIVGTSMERRDLSGSNVATHLTALYVQANDSTIRGFALNSLYEFGGSDTSLWGGTPLFVNGNNNVVEANFIGTDATGTTTLQNFQGLLFEGNGNRIGGTTPAQRNVLSGNFQYAIDLFFGTGNVIEGNLIGTDVTGTSALGNGRGVASESFAVRLDGNDNVFGGTVPGAANVIAATLGDALLLVDAEGTLVQGNLIGTDVTGTKALGNQGSGIQVSEFREHPPGPGVTIGGTAPGAGNVISNNREGIDLELGSGALIQGNRIGTDTTGTLDFGNSDSGILITGTDQQVGGAEPGAGNLISCNGRFGIFVLGIGGRTTTAVIQGNHIGTQADGVSPMGNGADGIALADTFTADSSGTGPIDVLIGGTDAADGNVIAYNRRNGVNVLAGQQIGVLSNLIYANGALAVDLNGDGVTPNDPNDADAGDNGLQNFPTFATAFTDGSRTQVEGTLNSTPNTAFLLQFFANPAADPSGFGEGQSLLGSHYVFTDATGNAPFTFTFATAVPAGQFISATATDPLNDTSEFAADVPVTTGTTATNRPPTANAGGPYTIHEGDGLTLDGSQSDDPDSDPLTYSWDINGDGTFGDATGAKPTLTWAQLQALGIVNGPSSFSIRVRVDDGQGHVVTSAPTSLTVLNVAPTVSAGPDLTVNEGDTVTITGTFTDPGTADTHTLNWHVDASNGQVIADGSGSTFAFVPQDNGVYMVTFAATDSDGATGTAVVQVNVNNAPPVATVSGLPTQGTVGVPINLTAAVTDASPIDTAAGFRYYWEAILETDSNVDFWVITPAFTFTPPKPGTYDIYFDATDKDGGTFRYFSTLDVVVAQADTAPTVTLGPAATINEGSAYASGGSFADPDAGDAWTAIVNYGDGTGDQPLALKSDKTFDLNHVYADNGGFDVTVTITDSAGLSGTQKTHVTVDNVAPAVTLGVPSSVTVGDAFSLGGAFADPGADTWTATVDYGDNSGPQPLTLAPDKTFALNHVYQMAGSFPVTVTVTDKDGGVGTAAVAELVNKLPTSLSAAPASATYGGTTTLAATLMAGGQPLAGKTLLFQINGVAVGPANTDANGTATLANVSLASLSAGPAMIGVSFAEDANDLAAGASAPLTVARAPLAVTVDGKSRVYGQGNPSLTGTIAGIRNGDDITASYSTIATNTSPVGSYPITATLDDPAGRLANYDVTVNDGTLTVLTTTLAAAGQNISTSEGSAFTGVVATFTTNNPIATAGDFAVTIHWGDGQTSTGMVSAIGGGGFQVAGGVTYADSGTFPLSIVIQDNAGLGTTSATTQANVANLPPMPTINGAPATANAGSTISVTATATDPSPADTAAGFAFGWVVTRTANGSATHVASGSGSAFSFVPNGAGVYTVTLTATDKDGGTGTTSDTVTVVAPNVAPVVTITGPAAGAVFSVDKPVTFTGTFTDPDSPGPHTAVWTLTAPGQPTITLPGVISGGHVTASYTFHAAGIYQVALAVTDDQGATGRASTIGTANARVVIYDANAGKITGGGWFDSPAGAYAGDPHFAGKVNFGFNAQYKRGEAVPTGQFQFNAGGFDFHSTAYDWLVVTGDKAQLQGTGMANGRRYAFRLTILDGSHTGRPDRIRIQIWDPLSGLVVYDNQPGANDGDDPITALGGGEAKIHR